MSKGTVSDKEFEQALLLRKLEFEVRDLESRWRTTGRAVKAILQAVAVLGGISTAIALVLSIREANVETQKEATLRDRELEQRRREAFIQHFSELSHVPTKLNSVPRVRFLLMSLRSLIGEAADPAMQRDDTKMVTEQLVFIATEELDFSALRTAADLDRTFAELWPAYQQYLRENTRDNTLILYKLFQGLRLLAEVEPEYFQTIDLENGEYRVRAYTKEATFRHFVTLASAYQLHWSLLQQGEERREYARRFAVALDNPGLAKDLFGDLAASYPLRAEEGSASPSEESPGTSRGDAATSSGTGPSPRP